ncbi:protein Mpv17-like isoform X1 [Branchiostoma lanceolatum]|uniref:protein Mpv17-like isoform X1 n=1 Tax=Branchiostoma lanceolatum TaxID=7740 RepID=UPI003454898D
MAGLWRGYVRLAQVYPFRTQVGTTGVLFLVGDAIAQFGVERRTLQTYDYARTARMSAVGLIWVGPVLRTWLVTLERVVVSTGPTAALKKMCLDQALMAPFFLGMFYPVVGLSRWDSWEDIKQLVKKEYLSTLFNNYKLWPAVQLANFYFVPLNLRLLVMNIVALGWNTYLSWRANIHTEDSPNS